MKKKIFGAVIIVAMAVAASWNFNQSKNGVKLSNLLSANVEALAEEEEDSGGISKPCPYKGGSCIVSVGDDYWIKSGYNKEKNN